MKFKGRVRDMSSEGSAVVEAVDDGRIYFVEGAWPGDEGTFEVIKFEKRFGYARIVSIETPSTDRVNVVCPHQGTSPGTCGGCSWMHGNYSSQLHHKTQRIRHSLERASLVNSNNNTVLKEIWGSTAQIGYRNRAQFKTNGNIVGFVAKGSNEIVPIKDCAVLNEKMAELFANIRNSLPREDWQVQRQSIWNFIEADDEMDSTDIRVNVRSTFRQGNSGQNLKMLEWVRQNVLAHVPPKATVLELYCGSGNFTEVLAADESALKITAVEGSDLALDILRHKKLKGVKIVCADLSNRNGFEMLANVVDAEAQSLLLDPPREGAKGVEALVTRLLNLRNIFYISCDVATFTRDASALSLLGFELAEVQPIDLFPQTPHVEILARFQRA